MRQQRGNRERRNEEILRREVCRWTGIQETWISASDSFASASEGQGCACLLQAQAVKLSPHAATQKAFVPFTQCYSGRELYLVGDHWVQKKTLQKLAATGKL